MNHHFRPFFYFFLIILLFGCQEKRPPNIVLIMADDLGYETIGANGGTTYQTPNIDLMANQGIRFEHCYAQPLCTPSRVQIMTGIYNVRNYVRFGLLDTNQTTFGHLFREAGYATCIVGKWQLGKDPVSPHQAGFDQYCLWQVSEGRVDSTGRDTRFSQPVLQTNRELKIYDSHDYGPDIVSQFGIDFMEKAAKDSRPFLLYYPMILTHCPFSPTPDSPEWLEDDTAVMKYKGHAHYFEDMVSYTDKIVGNINQKLEELGIAENTIVIFTGDNGTDIPVVSTLNGRKVAGAKGQSTDAGTRVPLLVQWPGTISAGMVNQDLVDFSDMLPTMCEIADIPAPGTIDGQSFMPQLMGKTGHPREWIYSWFSRNGADSLARVFARNQRYKLYRNGEFYDVPNDYEEENPLNETELSPEQKKIHKMLQGVIDQYEGRRLEEIPSE
ncbi:MAG: sulfatase-like hydrolase/transferase [Bacteroidetes bacterium]|nr:sulfatase-like hydrolase/transferase [Bacteroidota bacterium]MCB0844592.1 sulfatase-like hydrolase/transferase [Bacteroidota bacterium]